ncbi:hypothetical protein ABZ916_23840 [Streptomyces sp. NPDC046853]|uniref:hypothetical protein n=1 Tax=Streptomyces sp. NPDC046853 TaxID=3154920 RepID=UPI0033EFEAD3
MLMPDELTSAMDARAEHRVISRFKGLADGRAAVFVTHNLENGGSLTASSRSTAAGCAKKAPGSN